MAETQKKGGKKNRKIDRHRNRSPAMARYRAESRWLVNKEKRQRKDAMRRAIKRKNPRPMTARARRRAVIGRASIPAT